MSSGLVSSRSRTLARKWGLFLGFFLLLLRPSVVGAAEPWTQEERELLLAGETVSREFRFTRGSATYVAGIAYRLVRARPRDILTALRDPNRLERIIPFTLEAKRLGEAKGLSRLRMRQGVGPLSGQYTLILAWDAVEPGGRFWLDKRAPHDLDDLWGFFRLQEWDEVQTLVTFGIAFDLPRGLSLFERQVLGAALRTPGRIPDEL